MRHDPDDIKAGLKEILEADLPVKQLLGARWIIRGTLDYIRHLEGELRRARFSDYDTGDE